MEESIPDGLRKAAEVLHWLGKYGVANTLTLLSRLMRARKIETFEQLEQLLAEEEAKARG